VAPASHKGITHGREGLVEDCERKNDGTMDQNPSKSMWFLCQFFAPSVNVCFFPKKNMLLFKKTTKHIKDEWGSDPRVSL
jgi:hypothetical protein